MSGRIGKNRVSTGLTVIGCTVSDVHFMGKGYSIELATCTVLNSDGTPLHKSESVLLDMYEPDDEQSAFVRKLSIKDISADIIDVHAAKVRGEMELSFVLHKDETTVVMRMNSGEPLYKSLVGVIENNEKLSAVISEPCCSANVAVACGRGDGIRSSTAFCLTPEDTSVVKLEAQVFDLSWDQPTGYRYDKEPIVIENSGPVLLEEHKRYVVSESISKVTLVVPERLTVETRETPVVTVNASCDVILMGETDSSVIDFKELYMTSFIGWRAHLGMSYDRWSHESRSDINLTLTVRDLLLNFENRNQCLLRGCYGTMYADTNVTLVNSVVRVENLLTTNRGESFPILASEFTFAQGSTKQSGTIRFYPVQNNLQQLWCNERLVNFKRKHWINASEAEKESVLAMLESLKVDKGVVPFLLRKDDSFIIATPPKSMWETAEGISSYASYLESIYVFTKDSIIDTEIESIVENNRYLRQNMMCFNVYYFSKDPLVVAEVSLGMEGHKGWDSLSETEKEFVYKKLLLEISEILYPGLCEEFGGSKVFTGGTCEGTAGAVYDELMTQLDRFKEHFANGTIGDLNEYDYPIKALSNYISTIKYSNKR